MNHVLRKKHATVIMSIITLTTDFGEKDYFVGAIKGDIYSQLDTRIVDISHGISPFNISEAAYVIKNAYQNFPKGTIHLIGVDSEKSIENIHVAILLDGHYFICADNGIMSMICTEITPKKIVEINIHHTVKKNNHGLETFVKVACHIARGGSLDIIGKTISHLKLTKAITPYVNDKKNQILGHVIYIDNYGNVITNITRSFFESCRKGRTFEISARQYKFNTIHETYNSIVDFSIPKNKRYSDGKRLVIFNTSGHLEIAIYKSNLQTVGGASSLLGLGYRSNITVEFKEI